MDNLRVRIKALHATIINSDNAEVRDYLIKELNKLIAINERNNGNK